MKLESQDEHPKHRSGRLILEHVSFVETVRLRVVSIGGAFANTVPLRHSLNEHADA